MSDILREIDKLEANLLPVKRGLEVRARRFLSIFLPAFITALVAPPQRWVFADVLSLALSVAVTALGEIDPSIPWSVLVGRFEQIRAGRLPDVPTNKGGGT